MLFYRQNYDFHKSLCVLCNLFLCIRDVLPVCLSIPQWIYSVTDKTKDHLSQLEPSESFYFHLFSFSEEVCQKYDNMRF